MTQLAEQFKKALQTYLNAPDSPEARRDLVAASGRLYVDVLTELQQKKLEKDTKVPFLKNAVFDEKGAVLSADVLEENLVIPEAPEYLEKIQNLFREVGLDSVYATKEEISRISALVRLAGASNLLFVNQSTEPLIIAQDLLSQRLDINQGKVVAYPIKDSPRHHALEDLKKALQLYFVDPTQQEYKNLLGDRALRFFNIMKQGVDDVAKKQREQQDSQEIPLDLDVYPGDAIANAVDYHVSSDMGDRLPVTEAEVKLLRELSNALANSRTLELKQMSVILKSIDQHWYRDPSVFVSSFEHAINSQLVLMNHAISKIADPETREKVKTAHTLLKDVVAVHFDQDETRQKQSYRKFSTNIHDIFAQSKAVIEKDIFLRKIRDNLLAAVVGLGVFYGIYLLATARQRHSFFLESKDIRALKSAEETIQDLNSMIRSVDDDVDESSSPSQGATSSD